MRRSSATLRYSGAPLCAAACEEHSCRGGQRHGRRRRAGRWARGLQLSAPLPCPRHCHLSGGQLLQQPLPPPRASRAEPAVRVAGHGGRGQRSSGFSLGRAAAQRRRPELPCYRCNAGRSGRWRHRQPRGVAGAQHVAVCRRCQRARAHSPVARVPPARTRHRTGMKQRRACSAAKGQVALDPGGGLTRAPPRPSAAAAAAAAPPPAPAAAAAAVPRARAGPGPAGPLGRCARARRPAPATGRVRVRPGRRPAVPARGTKAGPPTLPPEPPAAAAGAVPAATAPSPAAPPAGCGAATPRAPQ